jgi:hypothetical protein
MSTQPHESDQHESGAAQPTVDILPATVARKTLFGVELPTASEPAAEPAWAPVPTGAVNPWTGAPAAPAPAPMPESVGPAPLAPPPLVPPPLVPPPLAPPAVARPASPEADQGPDARRFLGMQLRRGRRADAEPQPGYPQPVSPQAPLAAWPTDLGGAVLADAEPAAAYVPPAPWGGPVVTEGEPQHAVDLGPTDAPPTDAPPAEAPDEAPVQALAPVIPLAPEPAPQHSADDEVRALKALLQTSEGQRAASEHRAEQAVAYAQQAQAELQQREASFAAQVQALEVRARTLANEAQDWQIRHREAETQVTELAQSVANAEARLAELRGERDELLAALEEATSPNAPVLDEEPAEQS